jgi:hypothetical protein
MTHPPILLLFSGNQHQCLAAAREYSVPIVILRTSPGETIARCDERHKSGVEAWFAEPYSRLSMYC